MEEKSVCFNCFFDFRSNTANYYSVDELVSLLAKHSMYDDALTLGLAFSATAPSTGKPPLINVLSTLVDRCCSFNVNSSSGSGSGSSNGATGSGSGNVDTAFTEFDLVRHNDSFTHALTPYEK